MSEMRWIPVNEQLPPDWNSVIVSYLQYHEVGKEIADFFKDTRIIGDKAYWIFDEVGVAEYYHENEFDREEIKSDHDFNDAECDEYIKSMVGWGINGENIPQNIEIVAWMPFPEPYKANE